jgi:iron complex outermembrane recepter protein
MHMQAGFHLRRLLCSLAALIAAGALVPGSSPAQTPAPAGDPQPNPATPAQGAPPAATTPGQITIPPVVVTAPAKRKATSPKKQPAPSTPTAPQPVTAAVAPPPAQGQQTAPGFPAQSAGQPVTTIDRDRMSETRAFSVGDVLQESPGVSIKQGNGPRDMGVSIRGSNARNGFGVRNIQVFEDGFPVTQPDGLSRTDLIDPHAYGGIDVWRGPSSALFGNYATGGAINFRTRPGGDVNGFEYGVDVGGFGYLNNYMTLSAKSGTFEYSLFASDVRGQGHLDNNGFNTQTVNFLGTYTPTSDDKFTVKFIHNDLVTDLSLRLSLNQFNQNPFQSHCATAATAAPGCGTINLFANGFNGAQVPQTAAQAGLGRDDQRTILGTRWEHKFGPGTEWQIQFVIDDRNISQPTGTTSAVGDFLSYNVMSHLAHKYSLFGMQATHIVGVFYNYLPNDSDTINLMPGGDATLRRKTQNVTGFTSNAGARVREEIKPDKAWTFALGAVIEKTELSAVSTNFGYAGSVNGVPTTISTIPAEREFLDRAYEAGVLFQANEQWQFRGRVATGYGTPQLSNLFVTSAGVPGNNTELQPQTNLGYDLGFDWTLARWFRLSLTGFYEYFQNELVTQSAGAGLQNFTFNAPASEHRGVEVAADWRPLSGWRATLVYSLNDQFYTDYFERLSVGAKTALINRAGNKIPGVSPNEVLARASYDQPSGPLKGMGAYLEYQWKDAFFMDNGNLLKAPGYDLFNLNFHYKVDVKEPRLDSVSLFFEVRNLLDRTYVASANNISNSLNAGTGLENGASVLANSTGSIYAGMPRTYYAGLKMKF